MSYKTVLLPVQVPDGKFCWEFTQDRSICQKFDNEGGTSWCTLFDTRLKDDKDGVLKCEECKILKDQKGEANVKRS